MPDADLSGYDNDLPPKVSSRHIKALQGKRLIGRGEEEGQDPLDLEGENLANSSEGPVSETNPPHDGS